MATAHRPCPLAPTSESTHAQRPPPRRGSPRSLRARSPDAGALSGCSSARRYRVAGAGRARAVRARRRAAFRAGRARLALGSGLVDGVVARDGRAARGVGARAARRHARRGARRLRLQPLALGIPGRRARLPARRLAHQGDLAAQLVAARRGGRIEHRCAHRGRREPRRRGGIQFRPDALRRVGDLARRAALRT